MRRLLLAALISAAGILPAAARDQFTGDLTEKQIMAIKVATIAESTNSHQIAARFVNQSLVADVSLLCKSN
jgi:hypothetical protein